MSSPTSTSYRTWVLGKPKLTVLVGPPCGGKTTMQKAMVEDGYRRVISATDRPRRNGEVSGEDYIFLPQGTLKHNFGSHVCRRTFHTENGCTWTYGIPYGVLDQVKDDPYQWVVVIDPVGAEELIELFKPVRLSILVVEVTANEETLIKRAMLRGDYIPEVSRRIIDDGLMLGRFRKKGYIDLMFDASRS